MIKTFKDKETKAIFNLEYSKRLPSHLQHIALRKLYMIDAAEDLKDLRIPPGNHLESLNGDRSGQHSIRINGKYRICFIWDDGDVFDVEIADYHS